MSALYWLWVIVTVVVFMFGAAVVGSDAALGAVLMLAAVVSAGWFYLAARFS